MGIAVGHTVGLEVVPWHVVEACRGLSWIPLEISVGLDVEIAVGIATTNAMGRHAVPQNASAVRVDPWRVRGGPLNAGVKAVECRGLPWVLSRHAAKQSNYVHPLIVLATGRAPIYTCGTSDVCVYLVASIHIQPPSRVFGPSHTNIRLAATCACWVLGTWSPVLCIATFC